MKKSIIYISILLVALVAFGALLFSNGSTDMDFWKEIGKLSHTVIAVFILISLANFLLFTLRWKIINHTAGKNNVSLIKMMFYRFVGYAVSYVTPVAQVGGEPFRVYFLEQHGITRKQAISTVVIDKVFETTMFAVFASIGVITLLIRGEDFSIEWLFALGVVLFVLGLFYYLTVFQDGFVTACFRFLRLHKLKKLEGVAEKIIETEKLMKDFFRNHKVALLSTILISLSTIAIIILEYWILFQFFGVHATFSQLLIVSALPLVGYIIPIPGAIGSLEVAQFTAFSLVGLDPALAVPVLLAIRLRDLSFVVIGFVYASTHGVTLLGKGAQKTDI